MNTTLTDPCAEAITRANKWIDIGRPIIKAMYAMEDAQRELMSASLAVTKPDRRTFDEAHGYVNKAREELYEMLDGIRDNALCDERRDAPAGNAPTDAAELMAWDSAWDDAEAFNDQLERETMTVVQAEKIVEAEHNAAFGL